MPEHFSYAIDAKLLLVPRMIQWRAALLLAASSPNSHLFIPSELEKEHRNKLQRILGSEGLAIELVDKDEARHLQPDIEIGLDRATRFTRCAYYVLATHKEPVPKESNIDCYLASNPPNFENFFKSRFNTHCPPLYWPPTNEPRSRPSSSPRFVVLNTNSSRENPIQRIQKLIPKEYPITRFSITSEPTEDSEELVTKLLPSTHLLYHIEADERRTSFATSANNAGIKAIPTELSKDIEQTVPIGNLRLQEALEKLEEHPFYKDRIRPKAIRLVEWSQGKLDSLDELYSLLQSLVPTCDPKDALACLERRLKPSELPILDEDTLKLECQLNFSNSFPAPSHTWMGLKDYQHGAYTAKNSSLPAQLYNNLDRAESHSRLYSSIVAALSGKMEDARSSRLYQDLLKTLALNLLRYAPNPDWFLQVQRIHRLEPEFVSVWSDELSYSARQSPVDQRCLKEICNTIVGGILFGVMQGASLSALRFESQAKLASDYAEKAVAISTKPEALLAKAIARCALGDTETAKETIKLCYKNHPEQSGLFGEVAIAHYTWNLARTYDITSRTELAKEVLELHQADYDVGKSKADHLIFQAHLHLQIGELEKQETVLLETYQKFEAARDGRYLSALHLIQKQRKDLALAQLLKDFNAGRLSQEGLDTAACLHWQQHRSIEQTLEIFKPSEPLNLRPSRYRVAACMLEEGVSLEDSTQVLDAEILPSYLDLPLYCASHYRSLGDLPSTLSEYERRSEPLNFEEKITASGDLTFRILASIQEETLNPDNTQASLQKTAYLKQWIEKQSRERNLGYFETHSLSRCYLYQGDSALAALYYANSTRLPTGDQGACLYHSFDMVILGREKDAQHFFDLFVWQFVDNSNWLLCYAGLGLLIDREEKAKEALTYLKSINPDYFYRPEADVMSLFWLAGISKATGAESSYHELRNLIENEYSNSPATPYLPLLDRFETGGSDNMRESIPFFDYPSADEREADAKFYKSLGYPNSHQ
ncbi:hypothetical protein [Pelagicoccus sp. SDUM812002]|uniref:hypothetical protein n=1 Tax=Pelagicoccus sp. SDUM812002 TaxID=3041266 RepID=UPI0028102C3C|nr:hypothetical protein [Pelagicoccus sp. SDUM812002]MDQ8186436.1 hypothetical protein [Pelagicoccus sp. SDUM812002]